MQHECHFFSYVCRNSLHDAHGKCGGNQPIYNLSQLCLHPRHNSMGALPCFRVQEKPKRTPPFWGTLYFDEPKAVQPSQKPQGGEHCALHLTAFSGWLCFGTTLQKSANGYPHKTTSPVGFHLGKLRISPATARRIHLGAHPTMLAAAGNPNTKLPSLRCRDRHAVPHLRAWAVCCFWLLPNLRMEPRVHPIQARLQQNGAVLGVLWQSAGEYL